MNYTCILPEFARVLDGLVALLLELEDAVDGELLAGRLAMHLGPAALARVALLLERAVTLGATELEYLAVVAHERDAVARIDGRRAKEALFQTHFWLVFSSIVTRIYDQ